MFKNSELGESIRKKFDTFTEPVEPFKRDFTENERNLMYKHFKGHSWSNIDYTGKIVLGGGEDSAGLYYITEDDLKLLN